MKSKNLAFVSSALEYTQRFFPVARQIENDGGKVFWISHRKAEFLWLKRQGVPAERILNTSEYRDVDLSSFRSTPRLAELETPQGPLIHDIILMDRILRVRSTEFAYGYVGFLDHILREFLARNHIVAITGGHDSALQILCLLEARKLGIKWAMATLTRLPKERFGFVTDQTHSEFFPFQPPDPANYPLAKRYLEDFQKAPLKPYFFNYSDSLRGILQTLPHHLRIFLMNFYHSLVEGGSVVTWYTNSQLARMYFRRRLNMLAIRLFRPFAQPSDERPFLLYALHTQPESSIDVIAAYFADQITLIKQISKATPVTHDIYVKSHPGDLGGKSLAFFREIKAIPGVRLIDPQVPSLELVKKASIVLSPAGTICLEAGLLGKPAIVFTDIFFKKLPTVHFCDSPIRLVSLIHELLNSNPAHDVTEKTIEYLKDIYDRSVIGQFDAFFDPFSQEELHTLSRSYLLMMRAALPEVLPRKADVLPVGSQRGIEADA